MATSGNPELIDLVGQVGGSGGVGGAIPTGVGNGATSGISGAAQAGVVGGITCGGMQAGVATATAAGMRSGVTVRFPIGGGNTNGMGVGPGTANASGMGIGGATQSRFGGPTGIPGVNSTGIGGVSASGAGVRMQVGVGGTNGGSTGGGGLFAELRGFDQRCFSSIGGPLPEATKQVRQQYRDLGNMLHDINERKLEYLEARVNQQGNMLLRYQQQLQTDRQESQRQRTEYEASANEKIVALQKQLDNETKVTGNLKTEIEKLRGTERFHENLIQNQSDIIEKREREIDAMRNERHLMETGKTAAENKVKDLLAENVRLNLKVCQSVSSDGQIAEASSPPPDAPQKLKMTNEDEKGDSVASGSSGLGTPRTRKGKPYFGMRMRRPRGSSHKK